MWWNGPDFMTKPQKDWPTEAEYVITDDPAKKRTEEIKTNFDQLFSASLRKPGGESDSSSDEVVYNFVVKLASRFESWFKTIKPVSYILRLQPINEFRKSEFSLEEKKKTEQFIWRVCQRHHFKLEYDCLKNEQPLNKSKLDCYNPFFDKETDTIRSNSRL